MAGPTENRNNLSTFFNEEYSSLRLYVQSKIRDTSERDAEDIVQDVALRIFSRADDAVPINNIGGFVYNAIRNRIIDIMRGKKEKKLPSEDIDRQWQEFAELFYGNADNNYSPEMEAALKKAITDLKPMYRDIVIAIDFEGYTYKELADRTGIPQGTLMSRRHRAMSELSKSLENIKESNYGT
ncbi:RNA polymerase sigma-70 factor, ECF subfamily [Flagellimonas taeanensis]|uniref:RNA polymerase sigma-70 factor, ECF subfamily n=1 Tax=Flagellimonas taeanensis TaxID=1005926 RepID=A0A1M6XZG2_9FLAO|nr:RNA polymerase sigma factor [Allomuricauda taeanensis]SFC04275.1 RNA polymerase sigma-70 factor, ECF subfamily [Allomuricauda taeanensis]SHL11316.1 RNA polymerase sigma-70 factor, ECF subfamily [Allomuricauda taeanensis]